MVVRLSEGSTIAVKGIWKAGRSNDNNTCMRNKQWYYYLKAWFGFQLFGFQLNGRMKAAKARVARLGLLCIGLLIKNIASPSQPCTLIQTRYFLKHKRTG